MAEHKHARPPARTDACLKNTNVNMPSAKCLLGEFTYNIILTRTKQNKGNIHRCLDLISYVVSPNPATNQPNEPNEPNQPNQPNQLNQQNHQNQQNELIGARLWLSWRRITRDGRRDQWRVITLSLHNEIVTVYSLILRNSTAGLSERVIDFQRRSSVARTLIPNNLHILLCVCGNNTGVLYRWCQFIEGIVRHCMICKVVRAYARTLLCITYACINLSIASVFISEKELC